MTARLIAWLTETRCRSRADDLAGTGSFYVMVLAVWLLWRWLS